MPARREKLQIEFFLPEGDSAPGEDRINEAVRRLARLIGRQMAREQFERRQLVEQRRTGQRPRES